jgi:molybdopterin-guanine dinucleotide biosynthesis protein A
MGTAKAGLEWHGSTLGHRAAAIAARAVDGPVVVVAAPGQQLPALPTGTEVACDAREGHGPLAALAAGIEAVGDRADAVFVSGVDAPFLHPAFVRYVLELLGPRDDVALPHVGGFAQPLAAAYRVATVTPQLRALLDEDPSPGSRALLARLRVKELDAATLLADPAVGALDPQLDSLHNVNDPAAYAAARSRMAPAVTLHHDGGEPRWVRAATLAAAGVTGSATIGGRATSDPHEPLVAGDIVRRSHDT